MENYGVMTAADTLRIERLLPGPLERVWQYLVDSDKRRQWLAAGELEQRSGAPLELVFRNGELSQSDDRAPDKYADIAEEAKLRGEVIDCESPRQLTLSWGSPSGEASEVRFELEPRGDKVLLVVTHSRLRSRDETLSVSAGWHTHLDILGAKLRGETPPSFWSEHTRLEAEYLQRLAQ